MASLFDGIGGFPKAGLRYGIKTLWASEIEPFPISVTKIRFPDMRHVGDITKLKGEKLPPVDIVCGGSPCQDVSCAGRRAGLAGERSGLFFEQIRIVKELRDADKRRAGTDESVRPRYMLWENVPGALSSGAEYGEDFRVVLEEICGVAAHGLSVPRPPGGRWQSAGAIMGDKFSVAWRVVDAQYWFVPQRRKRIVLVADFAGYSASEILFEQDRLLGHFTPREKAREAAAAGSGEGSANAGGAQISWAANQRDEVRDLHDISAAVCAQPGMKQQTFVTTIPINTQIATRHERLGDGTGLGIGGEGDPAFTLQAAHSHAVFSAERGSLTPWDTQQARIHTPDGVAPAVCGADGGGGSNPAGLLLETESLTGWDVQSHRIHSDGGGHGYVASFCAGAGAKAGGIGYQEETAPTLKAAQSGNLMPSIVVLNDQGGDRMDISENMTGTLRSQMDNHPPLVMATQQGGAEICEDLCPTITSAAGTSGNNQPVLFESHGNDARYDGPLDVCPTVSSSFGEGGGNIPLTLDTQDADAYAIAGNIIGRKTKNGGNGLGIQKNISPTLTSTDRPAVYSQQRSDEYVENDVVSTQAARQYKDATDLVCDVAGLDCRAGSENKELCATLQAHPGGGYSLNTLHPVRIQNLIRRLTPLECERLMDYDDGWTDVPGASDSKRYKALGNSVVVSCMEYVLRGIAYFLSQEKAGE